MSKDDPKDPSTPSPGDKASLTDELGRKIGEAAAREAGRRIVDGVTTGARRAVGEASERAKKAIDGALSDAEEQVTARAREAEARRAASGLPPTSGDDPEWAAGLTEAGDEAFRRAGVGGSAPRSEGEASEEERAAEEARAQERRAAARAQLEAMRAARSSGQTSDAVSEVLARAAAARAAASETDDDLEPPPTPEEPALSEEPEPLTEAGVELGGEEFDEIDPAEAALARARALRGVPEPGEDDAFADMDPAEAALARARQARGVSDEPVQDAFSHLPPAEAALARARQARGVSDEPVQDAFSHLSPAEAALARARQARGEMGQIEPDPFAHLPPAEAALARARQARIDAGAKPEAFDRIAELARVRALADEAFEEGQRRAEADPLAAARRLMQAAEERCGSTRGSDLESGAERLARIQAEAAAGPRSTDDVLRRAAELRASLGGRTPAPDPAAAARRELERRRLEREEPSPDVGRSDLFHGEDSGEAPPAEDSESTTTDDPNAPPKRRL